MKNCFFILAFSIHILATGQTVKTNTLYTGMVNELEIDKGNFECKDLLIQSDHGVVYQDKCSFQFFSELPGDIHFTIYKRTLNGLTKLNETDFKVRFLEKPTFKIGFGLARVPLFEIKRQDTVSVICGRQNYKVKEFQLVAFFRETNTFKVVKNYGAKLSDEAKRLFDQLKLEDSVTFDSIISTDSKGNDIHVSPSTITVH